MSTPRQRFVYLASCVENRERIVELAAVLRGRGHVVTSDWHDDPDNTRVKEGVLTQADRNRLSSQNVACIERGDVVLAIADPRCRGTLFELGVAVGITLGAWGVDGPYTIVVVGDPASITLMASHPMIKWVDTVDAALALIGREAGT